MNKHILVVIFFFFTKTYGQTILSGTVKSKEEALIGANILAKPITKGAKFSYAVTDVNGEYTLKLTKDAQYVFTVSFIGYITLKENVLLNELTIRKNFILKQDPNELQEVVINYTEPIVTKKDTTTYRVKAFTNGKERKLRQVLKKLPGVEVDRAGNVTVKGKKVTTVLVEDKEFFTGDSKLAVNNIPANVIKEVQVIEDYHESDLLKGLETSEEVALNINLKEDKKKFAFGDLEIGGGEKNRYVFHPTLFKYSKKLSYTFLGDINNTSSKSFTLKDYINYEGGVDVDNLGVIFKSPITKLLRGDDFYNNKHYFGGLNFQYDVNNKNRWTAFVIALDDKSNEEEQLNNTYTLDDIQENRKTDKTNKQSILLGKLQLKSAPLDDLRIKFENKIEVVSVNSNLGTESEVVDNNNLIFSKKDKINSFSLQTGLKMEKRFSNRHTSQGKIYFNFLKTTENQNWLANDNIFSAQLPIVVNENIHLKEVVEQKDYELKSLLKHFWIVNPTNHLFLSIKNDLFITDYNNSLNQILPNNETESFENFKNNSLDQQLFSSAVIQYKYLLGNVFLTTQLEYLNYLRVNNQFLEQQNINKIFVLPEFKANWEIDNKRSLQFTYLLKNKYPKLQQLFLNNTLNNFNTVKTGDINLKESSYHTFRLYFKKYQNYGWTFYYKLNYKLIKDKIQNRYFQNGIYSTNSPININMPEKEFNSSLNINYNYKYWKVNLKANYTNRRYVTFNLDNETLAKNNNFSISGGFKSFYINGPNLNASLSHTYNDNNNLFFNSIYNRTKLDLGLNYDVGNWQFNMDGKYSYFKNKVSETTNTFKEINTSVFYQKEDSAWAFELKATNILNNRYRISSSLSDVLFSETRTALFPRTILAKIIYKI